MDLIDNKGRHVQIIRKIKRIWRIAFKHYHITDDGYGSMPCSYIVIHIPFYAIWIST